MRDTNEIIEDLEYQVYLHRDNGTLCRLLQEAIDKINELEEKSSNKAV